jgi:hypothetical protein
MPWLLGGSYSFLRSSFECWTLGLWFACYPVSQMRNTKLWCNFHTAHCSSIEKRSISSQATSIETSRLYVGIGWDFFRSNSLLFWPEIGHTWILVLSPNLPFAYVKVITLLSPQDPRVPVDFGRGFDTLRTLLPTRGLRKRGDGSTCVIVHLWVLSTIYTGRYVRNSYAVNII